MATVNSPPSTPIDNDPAGNSGPVNGTVIEGATAGTTVGITALAIDLDGDTITYSLTSSAGGRFAIDSSTGVVTVLDGTLLNFETATSHSITVQADDGQGGINSQTFSIGVANANPSTPTDSDGTANSVVEGAAANTLVGITAASTDPNGPAVAYSITADSSGGGFLIDSATGVVSVNDPMLINYETAPGHAYSITVQASDGQGGISSQTFSIDVTNANPSAPTDSDGTANSVVEGAAANTLVGITGASTDPNGPAVAYSITADSSSGGFKIDSATGVVSVNDPTLINYETAAGHAYSLTVQASDGQGGTSAQTFSVAVTDVAPTASVDTYTGASSVDEDQTLNIAAAAGVLANDHDVNGGPITAVLDIGPAHAASFTLNPDGSFSYTPTANYNGADSFTYHAFDGSLTSATVAANITINAVNDAPVFTNLGEGAHPNFVENGSSVVLDNNVTVSDPELNAAGNYGGAILTLSRNGGANPDDTFAATGTLDLANSNGLGENVSLDGGATFIGTFNQPGDGTFSVTLNASATAANVASVMQQIVYANASDNPEASVQIGWSFDDGNTGVQGSGGTGAATGSVTVDITQVDDAPVLINVAATAAYVPGTAGAVLSSTLGIFDPDAVAPSPLQGLASATIKIESGFFAGDDLFVNLATSGGHFVTPDGDTSNISVQSNVLGTLILSGNDTVTHYQSVLDAVSYHSTAADPSNGGANPTRNISWQVNDGALDSQTPNPDPNNLVSETVLHFDVAPIVDLDASGAGTGFTTSFTENGAPIAIVDTDVSIVDSDDVSLDTATIVLTNAKPTDALSIAGGLPGGIDSSIDTSTPGQISLHLSNAASLADYQTALGQVRFVNSSDTPNTTDRDITVFVTNGADSNVAHATIHVIAVDDAPVAANASASGSEDTPISGIVSATDVDNTPSQLSYSLVGTNGGAAHGAVVFHADGSFTYNPVHDFNGSDSFSYKANDSQLDSNVATVGLTVSAVNDAPVAANGSASGNEDTTINGTLSATDVDNTAAQLTYNLVGTNGGAAHGSVVVHADGTFTYTPAPNFNGSDSFSFKANDGALDSNLATESLTINAVNDAPVNTVPGPVNAQNGLDAAIIGLAVSDVDAVSLTTSLHVDHGTLTVAAVGGAAVVGSGTGTVTLSGSVAQIDAALGAANNVVYHSTFDFIGTDHLTMTSNDGGGTGSGGPQTDIDVVDINAGHSIGAFIAFSILGSSDFHLH